MNIARAEQHDFPALIKLWHECGLTRPWNDPENDLRFALKGPASTVLAGKVEGEIVSSVMVGHDGHRGALYYLATAPHHQGKGFGRAIHDAAVDWLSSQGVWKINILVRNENEKVHGFYKSLGYGQNQATSFAKQITK